MLPRGDERAATEYQTPEEYLKDGHNLGWLQKMKILVIYILWVWCCVVVTPFALPMKRHETETSH